MTPQSLIRQASLARIDLNVRDGSLYALPAGGPVSEVLLAAIRDQKAAIIQALTVWPHIATLREVTLARCRPLAPADLTDAERVKAETLSAELIDAGGLGQFVIEIMDFWNDLTERERLQAAWCWDCDVAHANA